MMQKFSVLMSVYKNETVSNFEMAMNSVIEQTVVPNEIVLVRDGKVSEELQTSIENYINRYNELITYVPLEKNGGLGNALNIGVKKAKYDLIARMDTDDIAVSNRFELQLKRFEQNPELDVVGGQIAEFINAPNNIVGKRNVPELHQDIVEYLKSRNAFNHPSVMYKKSSVIEAGNYIEMHYVEDYYLWLRMMLNGAKFVNLPNVIVNMRVSYDMYQRRGGYTYFCILKQLERYKKKNKIISLFVYMKNIVIRFIQCVLLPNKLRGWMYKSVLRNKFSYAKKR